MTLLPFTKLQHQKMRVLLQVYRFLLPLIPGCVWYFLDHFKKLDVVLSSCLEFAGPVQPGRTDSSLKQWQGDMQVPQTLLWFGWGWGAALLPADTWASIHVNVAPLIHAWGYAGTVTHSQPQPALQSKYVNIVQSIFLLLLLAWKPRFHPTLSQVWPPGSTQPNECPANREGKQADATVNNSLLSI